MRVLVENEAGSRTKHLYDENMFKLKSVRTVQRPYPFPYGFIIGTRSGDGMCLDCFLLTRNPLKSGEIVDAEPIGAFEQIEDGQEDHNILAIPIGDNFEITAALQDELTDFVLNVFADLPGKHIAVGRFLGRDEAVLLIEQSRAWAGAIGIIR